MTSCYQRLLILILVVLACQMDSASSFVVSRLRVRLIEVPKAVSIGKARWTSKSATLKQPKSTAIFSSPQQKQEQEPPPTTGNKNNSNYNDDAFGLVFLCGATVAQDAIFATTFLTLSAFAAIATRQNKLPAGNRVPAAVAGATLLVTPILTYAVENLSSALATTTTTTADFLTSINPSAAWIEVALCSASMLYGFVLAPEKND